MSKSAAISEDQARGSRLRALTARPTTPQAGAFVSLLLFSIPLTFVTGISLFATDLLNARSLVVFLSLEIAAIAMASVVLGRARGDRFDLFEPSMVVNLVFLLYYCVRPIYLMSAMSHAATDMFVANNPAVATDFAWAVGYEGLGLVCFHAGYYAMKRHLCEGSRLRGSLRRWDTRRVTHVAFIGGALAMVSVAITISASGGIEGALAYAGRLRGITEGYAYGLLGAVYFPIILVLLLVDHLLGHPRKISIIFFSIMTVGYYALIGNRTSIVSALLSCMIVYVYMRGIKKPWWFAVLSIATGIVVVPAVTFWGFARQYNVAASDMPMVVNIMRDEDSGAFYSQILGELSAVDSFAAILHGGPSVFPFRYGQTYSDVALFVVPRTVWPDKPKSFSGAVGTYVMGDGNDVPPGEVGELYVNFHVFGIVIGMSIIGSLMGIIYSRAMGSSAGGVALYALLIPYVGSLLSHNALGGIVLLLTAVLPMWPAVLYIEAVRRGGGRSLYQLETS